VRRAVRKHLGDFLAILALAAVAVGVGAYILANERFRFPLVGTKPFTVQAELASAQAVQPGQGQTVRIAGVKVGQIGNVDLEDGKAVVELDIEPKYKAMIRSDATALLRSKTGLKDMFVEVDPGEGRPLRENQRIPVANTLPDVNVDEILSGLDADTRSYLRLLISGAGKGLAGRGSDLREAFARLGPLHRDLARVTKGIARRRRNLRRLVHDYGLLTSQLGRHDRDIVRFVQASNAVFESLASEDGNISLAVARLPRALRTTEGTLGDVGRLGQELGPALEALRPPIRRLDQVNRALVPLARGTTPAIRDEIRPFARAAQPFTRNLGPAARDLSRAAPSLTSSFLELNRLFNIGAYNPRGAEPLTGDLARDRARQEGYLYWLAWTGQNTDSLFSTSDAQGPIRRVAFGGLQCAILDAVVLEPQFPPAKARRIVPPKVVELVSTALLPAPAADNQIIPALVKYVGQRGLCENPAGLTIPPPAP
jgi:phospholipid/cholesterol/gamma-HCH transport system substrate-binding protein